MSKFKDKINTELSFLQPDMTADDIINTASKSQKIVTFKKATLIAASLILVLTMIFVPFHNEKSSFIIIANAETTTDSATPESVEITGDELNTESFVEIKSDEPNYISYNFSYILDVNASDTQIYKKYLFHSFDKILNIKVKGDDIETITYKMNNGSLTSYTTKYIDSNTTEYHLDNTTGDKQTQITIDYDNQDSTSFFLNPICSNVDKYNNENKMYFSLKDTGEIVDSSVDTVLNEDGEIIEYNSKDIIASGYKDSDTIATNEEIEKLKEYIEKDDMVGFHNYQNQIIKRIIENMTLDVTIEKTNGNTQTKTLEFLYTPEPFNESNLFYYDITQTTSMSSGTLSARIKK